MIFPQSKSADQPQPPTLVPLRSPTVELEPATQRIIPESENMFAAAARAYANGDYQGGEEMTVAAHRRAITENQPGAAQRFENYLQAKSDRIDAMPDAKRMSQADRLRMIEAQQDAAALSCARGPNERNRTR